MKQAQGFLLVVCFLVCPLLFFTNLTRNPYVIQISLLNMGLILLAALHFGRNALDGTFRLPRTPVDLPLVSWLGVCSLSWAVAYFGHAPFFRPAMAGEGARNFLFLLVNSLFPFYLAAVCAREGGDGDVSLAPWVAFVLLWGILWSAFPQMRGPGAAAADIWGHVWDGYGAFLWVLGLGAALWLCRKGRGIDYLHLALAAGFLASVYGVLQYFNIELVWPSALNPYGGRSVSTFGNPNFMSSYNVILLPAASVLFIRSQGSRRLVYGALALALEAGLLCSLTRSSWLGAAVGLGVLGLFPALRAGVKEDPRPHGLLLGLGLTMAILWPQSAIVSGYSPSVLGRLAEIGRAVKEGGAYSPWHQRVLIWTCAWLMGAENPLTGKGYGLLELFYPFYQGHILNALDFFRMMRTHANNAHNEILEVWAQTGLLGLGVLFWLWTAFFTAVRRRFRSGGGEDALPAAAAAGAAGMLADNLLNVSLHFAVPGFLFWWTAGTAMGCFERKDRVLRVPRALAMGAVALAALLAAAGSWYWARVWFREVHYFAGFKLLRQGALPSAVKQLEISRDWGPGEVNAIYELGNAYARSERFPEADRVYAEALRANAGYDEIYYNIGVLKSSRLGQVEGSIPFFRVAWWINPLSNELYNSLGNLYLRDPGRYRQEALELLGRAAHFFPDNPNHWNNLGYLHSLGRRYDEAQAAYARALAIDPSLAIAEKNLAALAARAHLPKPAILLGLQELRELDARVARRDYSEETLALAGRVAARLPEMPKARFLWGSLLLARGRPAEAVTPLEWVVRREGGHVWAHVNLGSAYMSLGRNAEAVREFRAALAIDPANAQARERLKTLGIL